MASQQSAPPPLSAQEEADLLAQEQLTRRMAVAMVQRLEEEERARRITEEAEAAAHPDSLRQRTFENILVVQEDLVRCLNRMKVGAGRREAGGQGGREAGQRWGKARMLQSCGVTRLLGLRSSDPRCAAVVRSYCCPFGKFISNKPYLCACVRE